MAEGRKAGAHSRQASRPDQVKRGRSRIVPPTNYIYVPWLGWYTRGQVVLGVLKAVGWGLLLYASLFAGALWASS